MNRYMVYASDYVKMDSDVILGGGTDNTEALQEVLDKALEWGRLHLVVDGAALVRGLVVHSNTTIECMDKSCGFYLADHSDCAVLRNSNPGYAEIRTRNVTLIGGTYNHNCMNQAHDVPSTNPDEACINMPERYRNDETLHATVAMEFIGIENLTVRDLVVRDQRTYAFTVGNFRHVYIENVFFELVNEILFGNQDGFHFWGPGQFLTVRNVGGRTQDDFMNIGPDERDGFSSITDVLVENVFLDRAFQGIHLLSRGTGRLDRVTIRNVTGSYRCYAFHINPWFISEKFGNFGRITFENIDLRPEENPYAKTDYQKPPFLFSFGGDIESLTLRNIHWYHPYDSRTVFYIGYPHHLIDHPFDRKPVIGDLTIDGFWANQQDHAGDDICYINVRGIVKRMNLRNIEVIRPEGAEKQGCFLKTMPDAEIRRLSMENCYLERINTLFDLREGKTEKLICESVFSMETDFTQCNSSNAVDRKCLQKI